MNCEICKRNPGTVETFIGTICLPCDAKTDVLARKKLETWKLPRFENEEMFYCGICELEHELSNTSCVQPDHDNVLIRYEDKHGV